MPLSSTSYRQAQLCHGRPDSFPIDRPLPAGLCRILCPKAIWALCRQQCLDITLAKCLNSCHIQWLYLAANGCKAKLN
jgi:hypothetical protein